MGAETVDPKKTQVVVPTSVAPKLSEMSPEDRAKKYQEIRRRMSESRIAVRGQSHLKYYWARKDDTNELSRLEWIGYEIVREPDILHPRISATGLKQDGTYVLGDVILMQIDKEISEFLDRENAKRAKDMAEGVKMTFATEAAKEGVPAFERDEDARKLTFIKQ